MHRFTGNSARGQAHQHNGHVLGNITYNIAAERQQDDSDTGSNKALSLSTRIVRPLDARFDGDEQAIVVWLKDNNLRVSKLMKRTCRFDTLASVKTRCTYDLNSGRCIAD